MCKKIFKKVIFGFMLLGISISSAKAESNCDYKAQNELKTAASNVKANYEIRKVVIDGYGNVHPELKYEDVETTPDGEAELEYVRAKAVYINLTNIVEDIYIKVTSDDPSMETSKYGITDMKNGVLSFKVPDIDIIRNYEITIYSNNPSCIGEELRKITITTPRYNEYSGIGMCENSDKYYCQEFITSEINKTEDEIAEELTKEYLEEVVNETKENKMFIYLLIGGVVLVLAGVATTAIIIKKRRSSVL